MNRHQDARSLVALAFVALFLAIAGLLTRAPVPVAAPGPSVTGGIDAPLIGTPGRP